MTSRVERVFVYEHTCAQASAGGSLAAEGWAMLRALLDDFARAPGVAAMTLLHETFPHEPAGVGVFRVGDEESPRFRELVRAADASLIIAPEFGDLLAERCRRVEEEGGRLLGPSSMAVDLAGDKLRLARHLAAAGVPTPPTAPLTDCPPFDFPLVVKPRDGAGSQATFLIRSPDELDRAAGFAGAEGWDGELIVQPYVGGFAVSAAFLLGPGREVALPPATQRLSDDGRFRYRGGALPLRPDLAERASDLARRAVRAVSGLAGYVGVDVILGDAADQVIEINPRLTTSYVGLRLLTEDNLAEAMLRTCRGEAVSLRWRDGVVEFASGHSTV